MSAIIRLTLFKIPSEEGLKEAVKLYSTLAQDAKKNGEPYIIKATGNTTYNDPRNQGYTFAALTMFKSEDDMKYFDEEDETHANMKGTLKPHVAGGPPLVVYMDGGLPN